MNKGNNSAVHNGKANTPEKRYSNAEAKDILSMCDRSLYQSRKDNLLPCSQKGKRGQVFYTWADFETYWANIRKQ